LVAKRLKVAEVAKFREAILKVQNYQCAVCGAPLRANSAKKPVLDHCHKGGHLRGVLCIMCNQAEGRIRTWLTRAKGKHTEEAFLGLLHAYLIAEPKYLGYLHPTHKTEDEKRLARNKKARLARAKAKEQQ